jgi:hypothetical protein
VQARFTTTTTATGAYNQVMSITLAWSNAVMTSHRSNTPVFNTVLQQMPLVGNITGTIRHTLPVCMVGVCDPTFLGVPDMLTPLECAGGVLWEWGAGVNSSPPDVDCAGAPCKWIRNRRACGNQGSSQGEAFCETAC